MQLILDIVVTAVSLFILFQHVWALRGHFTSTHMTLPAKLISLMVAVTSLLFLFLLWTRPQPAAAQVIGAAMEIASLALFRGAVTASRKARLRFAFDPDKPHGLVSDGAYRYVRHPFYTSYLIYWIGWAVTTWTAVAAVPVVIILALYWAAARMEERNFAATPLAADYEDYRRRTGFFWPRVIR